MFSFLSWIFFGLVVGLIVKAIHPGEEPLGFLPTIGIGVAGSYTGGAINWFFYGENSFLRPSGLFMSIVGGIIFCMFWRLYRLRTEGRTFMGAKR